MGFSNPDRDTLVEHRGPNGTRRFGVEQLHAAFDWDDVQRNKDLYPVKALVVIRSQ